MKINFNVKYKALIKELKSQAPFEPDVALILGSGLGEFANSVKLSLSVPTNSLPAYPRSTVEGHKGFIHFGELGNKKLLLFQGRIHFYEGYKLEQVILPVFIASVLGTKTLILTNAAGGINPNFKPGDLMLVNAYYPFFIKREMAWLFGTVDVATKNRFVDFPSSGLNQKILTAALENKIHLKEGGYWYSKGPNYETPAEIRMMALGGADAVGMSTAHEAIAANYFGMENAALSLITNYAAGISSQKLSHEEVIETGKEAKARFEKLVKSVIEII